MNLKSRTFVATPAYRGDVVMQYAHSIVRDSVVAMVQGHFVEAPHFINNTYIHIARNQAVNAFLLGDHDFLMFIDADMGWSENALAQILDLPREMDIVGGVYRTKEDKPRYPFNPKPHVPVAFPICEVSHVATGFMRVTRHALETMRAAYQTGRYFDHIVDENDVEWGDDMAFCKRALACGLRVYAKFDIEFEHVGPKPWKGRAMDDLAHQEGLVVEAVEILNRAA